MRLGPRIAQLRRHLPGIMPSDAGVSAALAPSLVRWATASDERSQTKSLYPAFKRFSAMGAPILPTPMNPRATLPVPGMSERSDQGGLRSG